MAIAVGSIYFAEGSGGSPLISVDYTPASMRLPDYFVNHRVHLHTRLRIYWINKPVFTEAEEHFANMGVKVYTRHCKYGDEGAWWPSSVGAIDPRTNGEDLVQPMVDRAHANDLSIILYHRHMEDAYIAQQHPGWVCVDENGAVLPAPRGDWLCLNSPYRDFFTTRMLELLDRGADGFYFDNKHMPEYGCWCPYCRAKFTTQTGLEPPDNHSYEDPNYLQYLQFKNETTEESMGYYIEQVHQIKPGFPMLIGCASIVFVNEPFMRSSLAQISPSPKGEYNMPIKSMRTNRFFRDYETDIPLPLWDVQFGFNFSYLRDAA